MSLTPDQRNTAAEALERLGHQLREGCGMNGCQIKAPKGMAPNGGCTCSTREIITALLRIGMYLEAPI